MNQITLNGKARVIEPGATLADVVATVQPQPQALATAVNGTFVPRSARTQVRLESGDEVLIFQPITGG